PDLYFHPFIIFHSIMWIERLFVLLVAVELLLLSRNGTAAHLLHAWTVYSRDQLIALMPDPQKYQLKFGEKHIGDAEVVVIIHIYVILFQHSDSLSYQVILVHPSEAVTELRRMNIEEPDRIFFKSRFRSSLFARTTTCNVCLRPTEQPVCNYTDLHTGEPWFCYKPTNLSCNARISNYNGGYKKNLTTMEKLFQRGVNMKVSIPASGPASVTILPKQKGTSSSGESEPSGYYYQGVWRALDGSTVHQFNTSSAITQCLKGKVVHMYGDSTMRQWFEYLNASLPDLKEFNLHSPKSIGPLMALDYANNIFVTHRAHGPPLRTVSVPSMELHYIANELDNVVGGSNTVVVFGIWAHFDNFPIEFYIRRLMSIRRAVVRLLSRAPGTVVVIRTGNPKSFTPSGAFVNSDWYTFQRLKALRAVFKGFNVHLVDAWEMVLAHHLPHNMHPQPPIIKNMINFLVLRRKKKSASGVSKSCLTRIVKTSKLICLLTRQNCLKCMLK
uniref:Neurexophilin and PC-esterase domain family member 3 n=1 Tax=Neolamprologus brichardi TaxID=32507 RepID=A0A3Q4GWE6_NEOBR